MADNRGSTPNPGQAAIVASGLIKHFGDVFALEGIDLYVAPGTVFGLLGPNGAGKTTTVRILTTILRPDSGEAKVLGHDVITEADAVRASIGLAGQYAAVDENLTGFENLRMVGKLTHLPKGLVKERAGELLERFSLSDAADRPVKTYSGGMRRRLDLAASLVHRPPVLFLDEPTTGLDPRSRVELWGVIEDLVADGTTVLLTTQYLEEADRLADRLAVVDHGRIIAEGTPAGMKAAMGSTVIEIGMPGEGSALLALQALAPLGVQPPTLDGHTVKLTVADGGAVLLDALRALDNEGIIPTGVTLREPSLDDVFLSLTGHTAVEASAA
ncbi:MAG TPA: ATP-binding cassette domain-containing protein [Acidimicrobiia bacterium]|nr:ATP-binding cassette domain-containing protein [Acidimicrobiia bacterium]